MNVEIHHEPLGYQMTDPQTWWDVVWNAGWRSLLNQMSEEEQKVFEKEHLQELTWVLVVMAFGLIPRCSLQWGRND